MDIQHVKGKENQVADALSRKLHGIYALYYSQPASQLLEQLKEKEQKDPEYQYLCQQMEDNEQQGKSSEFGKNKDQVLTFRGRIYMPNRTGLKELILNEFHRSNYAGHLGCQKMLTAIRKVYYWPSMRNNIA